MWEEFDKATGDVMVFLERNQYACGTQAVHLRCYKRLREYLNENGEAYGTQTAESWLKAISAAQCDGQTKEFRRALERLDAAYSHRETGSTSGKSAMRQAYRSLPPWCNALLEDFVAEMSGTYGPDYTQAAKASVARFLTGMAGMGICAPEGISHRAVVDYCREGGGVKGASKIASSAEKGHIRKFLQHLAGRGMIRMSVHMALDQSVFTRIVFLDSLDDKARGGFLAEAKSPGMSAESYYEMALKMDPLVVQLKYSGTARHIFSIAFKELFVFLEANSLGYSAGAALLWANLMSRYTVQWMSFRRALMLFEQFRENGRIDPGKIYRYLPDRAGLLPEWCRNDYEAYVRLKEKACLAESTLDMCRNSCLRLMEYLCSIGISAWGQVTPETLKEFHRQDLHSTPEGKNAYASKIRQFLEYLGDTGRVPPTIFMAVPNESSQRTGIVKTLGDAEVEGIYGRIRIARNAIELRDAAMILIGLRMGIRASDIVNLMFGDISFEKRTVAVMQKKTGVFLRLPMPVEVGNSICRYILHGRPDTGSEFVFVNHKAPYGRLHRSVCMNALRRALPDKPGGFRITRKTFASRMLANNVEAGRIAETLGHVSNSSVMAYLSTDGERMRLCALPLGSIPVKGGALLWPTS